MKISNSVNSTFRQIGIDKTSKIIGTNTRVIKRKLIRDYSKHFTKEELSELNKLSLEDINKILDVRVGRFN